MRGSIVYLAYNDFKIHKRGVVNIIEGQARNQIFNTHFCITWGNKTEVYRHQNLICISIKKKKFLWIFILNLILLKLKRKYICLFIHSHNPIMSFFSLMNNHILTVHDGLFYLAKSKGESIIKTSAFYCIEKVVYYRTQTIHFISNFTKSKALIWNKKKSVIIYGTTPFEPYVLNKNIHFKELKKKQEKIIFTVRGIEQRARIDLIIDLAECMKQDNYCFYIAGKGPLLDYYNNVIEKKQLKNIVLLGFISDMDLFSYYNAADMVLCISEYGEGLGLPIIEGYLFNKPVIASNRCAMPEIIIEKKYLVENNVRDIYEKIKEVIATNNNKDFIEYYMQKFTHKKKIKEISALYQSLLK